MLSSPPTISQEDHDEDDADQSDSGSSGGSDVTEKSDIKSESIDGEVDTVVNKTIDDEDDAAPVLPIPSQVMYENRNILNLASNVWNSGRFMQFTVLPENNVNCFFQNRAQYWRLANSEAARDAMEKCSCCDFSYTPHLFGQAGNGSAAAKNPITDSLVTFLKNNLADYQSPAMPSANVNANNTPMPPSNMNGSGGNQGPPNRRMFNNNNNAPSYAAYQMMQQQQQQQYPNNQNTGYYGNNAGYNQMNAAAGGGYNGTALALLNLMNASHVTSGAAFQATLNNSTRYFNNNMNTNNNGFGLYKQF